MSDKYYEFSNRYGIRNMHLKKSFDSYNYHRPASSYYMDDREEIVELEMPRRALEHLIDSDREFTRANQDGLDEAYMRKIHPAIKDAYDKYRMLLELYR